MVRDRRTSTAATAWTWYLDAARKRFGASGWRIAQAAGRIVFDARTVVYARAGSVADLERQGLVRRTRRPRRGNLTGTVAYRCAPSSACASTGSAWRGARPARELGQQGPSGLPRAAPARGRPRDGAGPGRDGAVALRPDGDRATALRAAEVARATA